MIAAISLLLMAAHLSSEVMWVRAIYIKSDREWVPLRISMVTAATVCGLNIATGRPALAALWLAATAADILVFRQRRRTQALAADAGQRRESNGRWESDQVLASLPPEDQKWLRREMDLATIRLSDRQESRRG